MNQECQIKDEDEICEENTRFNFRRFKPEELEKKYSPFERTHKKEFPFLFQKKRTGSREDNKISLDEIITKIADISFNTVPVHLEPNQFIHNGGIYEPSTPPFSPFVQGSPLPSLLVEDLKLENTLVLDGEK